MNKLALNKVFVHKLQLAAAPSARFTSAKFNPKEASPISFDTLTNESFKPWTNKIYPTASEITNVVASDGNASHNFQKQVYEKVKKALYPGVEDGYQLYESYGNNNGHLYIVASRIKMGLNPKELIENGHWFLAYVASIHPDTFIFEDDSPLGKDLRNKDLCSFTRSCYVQKNRDEINEIHDSIAENIVKTGKIPPGLSMYINGNIIDARQVEMQKFDGGMFQLSFQAFTWEDEHSLSGQATHSLLFDPAHPDEILYIVWGSGEGWFGADQMNGPVSRILWKAVADTFAQVYTSMRESGSFGTTAREKAWDGLVCRPWPKSKEAAIRRYLATWFMGFTTPAGVEIKRRITGSIYNKGALIPYVPFDIKKWEEEHVLVPGNEIDIDAYKLDELSLEGLLAISDSYELKEKEPMAKDIEGGAKYFEDAIHGSALMQPSYDLAMKDLAMPYAASKNDLDGDKK